MSLIFTLVSDWFSYHFSGTERLITHFGEGGLLILILLAAAYFSPVAKRLFLELAIATAIALGSMGVGVYDEHLKCNARITAEKQAENHRVSRAVERARSGSPDERVRNDPFATGH